MKLLQIIISYYHGEARHGFWAAVIGALLLIGSLVLWRWASPLSLIKGFFVPMLLFGLLVGIGGAADGAYTSKAASGKIALYQKDPTTFLKHEKVKTEKTHRGWRGIKMLWGTLGLSGLVLSLLTRQPLWIGAGLGTVALTILISLFEFYSMQFNERYYHTIQSATAQDPHTKIQGFHSDIQRQLKIQQTPIEPQANKQENIQLKTNILSSDVALSDSLTTVPDPIITAVVLKDSVIVNIPYSLKTPAPTNEPAPIYHNDKKTKVVDYYTSNLIQANGANARHCWFSKKYIKE